MIDNLDLFLSKNRISKLAWEQSNLSWEELKAIGSEHESRIPNLEATASLLANTVQRNDAVHSVRWRVKDTGHLLAKIVRKRAEGNEKYANISIGTYDAIVTDLIGIRALHLFKSDFEVIHEVIKNLFLLEEDPVAYVRAGDDDQFSEQLRSMGYLVKPHPSGYRSIHYVIATQPLKKKIFVELQVRTIFEEGWSEIDHIVRYPNYSNDEMLIYLLTIFNRMAGSADEMGGFVKILAAEQTEVKERMLGVIKERDESLAKVDSLLAQLEGRKGDDSSNEKIKQLKKEVNKIKAVTAPVTTQMSAKSALNLLRLLGTPGEAFSWDKALSAIETQRKLDDIASRAAKNLVILKSPTSPDGSAAG
ncbi:RelA/SpoT domain-containing protein [Duganella sp. Leaf61]|uniref:RelA/SpoT domain-containing protein n=1 Tax=Duganella sp. Leaf61 TaxID=1736227 RepID=UPI001E28C4DA|nr:RelA/SpoT domain-containing protein [Duganella sp. Leaf61]